MLCLFHFDIKVLFCIDLTAHRNTAFSESKVESVLGKVVTHTDIHGSNFVYYPIKVKLDQLVDELIGKNYLPVMLIVE